jgi:FkbM family methyltransferase
MANSIRQTTDKKGALADRFWRRKAPVLPVLLGGDEGEEGLYGREMLTIYPMRDLQIAVPPNDSMFDCITKGWDFEPQLLNAFLEAVRSGHRVLDIGANIGILTLFAAQKGAKVVAIEASSDNALILAANVALNNLDGVTVYPVAVSDKFEMATFRRLGNTNMVLRPLPLTVQTVDEFGAAMALPLDTILNGEKFDVVKIDVEGREFACLAHSTLLDQKPIVFTEYSPLFIKDGCGVDGIEYLDLFFRRGYEATILHRDMSRETTSDPAALNERWCSYMERGNTHLDLMMVA